MKTIYTFRPLPIRLSEENRGRGRKGRKEAEPTDVRDMCRPFPQKPTEEKREQRRTGRKSSEDKGRKVKKMKNRGEGL